MKGTHLTLEDRKWIQHGLEEGFSKAKIASTNGYSLSFRSDSETLPSLK